MGRLLGLALLFAFPLSVSAATFQVDSTLDLSDDTPGDGVCSTFIIISLDPLIADFVCTLRGAIQETNALPGPDEVDVPAHEYVLSAVGRDEDAAASGDLDVTDELELRGEGAGTTVVGGPADPDNDRVFHVLAGASLALHDLSVRDGRNDLGGGIRNDGALGLIDVEVSGNTADGARGVHAGGGILNIGRLVLLRTTVAGNRAAPASGESRGGGIDNSDTLFLAESTIANNEAEDGAGIFQLNGTLMAWNSTFSGNRAGSGGAFYIAGTSSEAAFGNVTITDNSASVGGGIFRFGGGVELRNSIIADNTAFVTAPDCAGGVFSLAYNLWGDTNGCTFFGIGSSTDQFGPAALGPLQDNGGPTDTHRPEVGSSAVDAGDPTGCSVDSAADIGTPLVLLPADQRGALRPADGDGVGGARCDIGAVELPEPRAGALALGVLFVLARRRAASQPSG